MMWTGCGSTTLCDGRCALGVSCTICVWLQMREMKGRLQAQQARTTALQQALEAATTQHIQVHCHCRLGTLVSGCLSRISSLNQTLHAFLVCPCRNLLLTCFSRSYVCRQPSFLDRDDLILGFQGHMVASNVLLLGAAGRTACTAGA